MNIELSSLLTTIKTQQIRNHLAQFETQTFFEKTQERYQKSLQQDEFYLPQNSPLQFYVFPQKNNHSNHYFDAMQEQQYDDLEAKIKSEILKTYNKYLFEDEQQSLLAQLYVLDKAVQIQEDKLRQTNLRIGIEESRRKKHPQNLIHPLSQPEQILPNAPKQDQKQKQQKYLRIYTTINVQIENQEVHQSPLIPQPQFEQEMRKNSEIIQRKSHRRYYSRNQNSSPKLSQNQRTLKINRSQITEQKIVESEKQSNIIVEPIKHTRLTVKQKIDEYSVGLFNQIKLNQNFLKKLKGSKNNKKQDRLRFQTKQKLSILISQFWQYNKKQHTKKDLIELPEP